MEVSVRNFGFGASDADLNVQVKVRVQGITMTKSELIDRIAGKQSQLSSKDVELAVKAILECMSQVLSEGDRIEIRGFGTYKVTTRKARVGRNPKNSEPVQIPEKKAIKWKMSKILYRRLNKNFTENKISATN